VLAGVTVAPEPESTVGILGPNGSGKSSLLRLLAGLDRPEDGGVELDGQSVAEMPRRAMARRVALVDQHAETDLSITVRDVVRLGRIPHAKMLGGDDGGGAAVADALAATGLLELQNRSWHTLSGGERQRTRIARALAQEPTELLLDEPTNHLDIAHQLEIMELIRRLDVTAIVALHDLNLAAMFCDHLIVLDAGEVVASGDPADVMTEELIADVYGVRCRITTDSAGPYVRFQCGAPTAWAEST